MVSKRLLHLVRHGEVENPGGVLYGRLPNFALSERGVQMAQAAADELKAAGRPVARVYASPLERAQQSAQPIAKAFGRDIEIEDRIIEPTNMFEGSVGKRAFKNPRNWLRFRNPLKPSWGEPYVNIAQRVRHAMDDAWDAADAAGDSGGDSAGEFASDTSAGDISSGDIVMVSHQAVIWAAHRDVNNEPLFHNPAKRRCELSSITSFERVDGVWREVQYRTPAHALMQGSIDVGAV